MKNMKPVACWSEKELLNGRVVDSLVIILKTKGCSWHKKDGCFMCGYYNDSDPSVKDEEVLAQLNSALEKMREEEVIKLYNSGSFFDETEISRELRHGILEALEGKAEKLVVESRPEFISEDEIKEVLRFAKNLEVAIGLESADERVLIQCVNKGITLEDYKRGASIAKDNGASIRTYLLIKPPFLTEKEAIEDAVDSAKTAAEYSDVISFNPLNVQKGTLVERLWRRGEYRAPWLWSVVRILEDSKGLNSRMLCQPSGGGTQRGAHNCGSCDKAILKALDEFSIGTRISFDDLDCSCREHWLDLLELEGFLRSSADAQKNYV